MFEVPLFRTLVQGALSLFRADPGSLTRWIPQGWALVFRDCSVWSTRRDGDRRVLARLVLSHLQIELLGRLRKASEGERGRVREVLLLTVNGIAAGLQTVG